MPSFIERAEVSLAVRAGMASNAKMKTAVVEILLNIGEGDIGDSKFIMNL